MIQLFSWKDSRTKRVCEGIARSFPERGRGRSNPLTVSIMRRVVALLQSGQFSFTFTPSRKTEFICIMLWLFITGSRASELLNSASNRGLHLEEIRLKIAPPMAPRVEQLPSWRRWESKMKRSRVNSAACGKPNRCHGFPLLSSLSPRVCLSLTVTRARGNARLTRASSQVY